MNTSGVTVFYQPICVTCLSQDRKLFPVNDSKSYASFLLNLSEGDMLCWECHFFVRKVAAFQSRAARAQALLASAAHHADVAKINSLSSLMITPIYLEVTLEAPDPLQLDVKTETMKEECENENLLYDCLTKDTCNSDTVSRDGSSQGMDDGDQNLLPVLNKQTEAKGDEGACGEAMSDDITNASLKSLLSTKRTLISIPNNQYKDVTLSTEIEKVENPQEKGKSENMLNQHTDVTLHRDNVYSDESSEGMGDDILLPVLNKQSEAKGDEGVCGEAISDDIANASLKSLLSRKSMIIIPPLAKKCKKYDKMTEKESAKEFSEKKGATEVEMVEQTAPTDPESGYTVLVLSEEEMLKWRERKKNMPVYATKAAALKCKHCIEPFNTMKIYKAHARRHDEDYGAFACRICGLRSVSESALSTHTTQHYRLLKCKLCAHEWDAPNAMRQHCSSAHGVPVTAWDCDQCDRKYSTSVQLARHAVHHRVVACRVCGARVPQAVFQQHMQLHKGVRRTCEVCGKECNGDYKLASHMKTHDPKVDEAAYCAECNMQFRTMNQYRSHLRYTRKHARSDDLPHKCGECGKSYPTRAALTLHADGLHGEERKHACAVCGQKFKTRSRRNHHARTVHKGVEGRKFVCEYCAKEFTNKATLRDHINTHTGARPFACPLCAATFGYKSALYLHGRYKHKIKKKNAKKVEESTCTQKEQDT